MLPSPNGRGYGELVLREQSLGAVGEGVAARAGRGRPHQLQLGSKLPSFRILLRREGYQPYSTSSTSIVSPLTRCDNAAAMKSSRSPSSTSDGDDEVMPVRRSLTS